MAKDPRFEGHVAYVEDYDMELARYLLAGADVWVNMPRPPMEASGTSGMKAAINGVPNLSVLDGWWLEGYREGNGWGFGEVSYSAAPTPTPCTNSSSTRWPPCTTTRTRRRAPRLGGHDERGHDRRGVVQRHPHGRRVPGAAVPAGQRQWGRPPGAQVGRRRLVPPGPFVIAIERLTPSGVCASPRRRRSPPARACETHRGLCGPTPRRDTVSSQAPARHPAHLHRPALGDDDVDVPEHRGGRDAGPGGVEVGLGEVEAQLAEDGGECDPAQGGRSAGEPDGGESGERREKSGSSPGPRCARPQPAPARPRASTTRMGQVIDQAVLPSKPAETVSSSAPPTTRTTSHGVSRRSEATAPAPGR